MFLGFKQGYLRELMVLTGSSGEQRDRGKDLVMHSVSGRVLSGSMKGKVDFCVIEGKLAVSV